MSNFTERCPNKDSFFFAKNTTLFMEVIDMLKIVKNNSGIKELQKYKYVLCCVAEGQTMYAKIGLRAIYGYILAQIKF